MHSHLSILSVVLFNMSYNIMTFYCLKAKIPISSMGQYIVLTQPQQPLHVHGPVRPTDDGGYQGFMFMLASLIGCDLSLSLILCQSSSKLHPTILLMTLSQRILNQCSMDLKSNAPVV